MAKKTAPVSDDEPEIIIPEVIDTIDDAQALAVQTSAQATIASVTDEQLGLIEATYGAYQINGDKKRAKEATQVKNKLVKVRTGVEKRRKEINRLFTDKINAEAKRVIDRTTKVEQHLAKEVLDYEQAEARRVQERIAHVRKSLLEAGFEDKGVMFVCGAEMLYEIEFEGITDERLEQLCDTARVFRQNEATAAAEAARRAAPVYLHQPALNELLQLTRGEFEPQAEAFKANGVVEISKEQYEEIKAAKLAAFLTPKPAEPPATAAPEISNDTAANATEFGIAPPPSTNPVKENHGFLSPKPPAASPTYETRTPPSEPQEHEPGFAASFGPAKKPEPIRIADEDFDAFERGYNHAKAQIISRMGNAENKYNRKEWIALFQSLRIIDAV